MLTFFGGIISKIYSIVLVVVGLVVLMFSGLTKWLGLVLMIVSFVFLFSSPLGILGLVVGFLMFRYRFFERLLRLIGVALLVFGILSFLGWLPWAAP